MRRGRRSKLRIAVDILRVISARVTWIMRGANMPYDRLIAALKELEERGLVFKNREVYRLTERGVEFLREFRRLERFLKAFGMEL